MFRIGLDDESDENPPNPMIGHSTLHVSTSCSPECVIFQELAVLECARTGNDIEANIDLSFQCVANLNRVTKSDSPELLAVGIFKVKSTTPPRYTVRPRYGTFLIYGPVENECPTTVIIKRKLQLVLLAAAASTLPTPSKGHNNSKVSSLRPAPLDKFLIDVKLSLNPNSSFCQGQQLKDEKERSAAFSQAVQLASIDREDWSKSKSGKEKDVASQIKRFLDTFSSVLIDDSDEGHTLPTEQLRVLPSLSSHGASLKCFLRTDETAVADDETSIPNSSKAKKPTISPAHKPQRVPMNDSRHKEDQNEDYDQEGVKLLEKHGVSKQTLKQKQEQLASLQKSVEALRSQIQSAKQQDKNIQEDTFATEAKVMKMRATIHELTELREKQRARAKGSNHRKPIPLWFSALVLVLTFVVVRWWRGPLPPGTPGLFDKVSLPMTVDYGSATDQAKLHRNRGSWL